MTTSEVVPKDVVESIFYFWRSVMEKDKARLTPEREQKIRRRLADGYSEREIRSAIMGCKDSAFHMGKNDAGVAYNDLTLILRNGSKMEEFMARRTTMTPEEREAKMADASKLQAILDKVAEKEKREAEEYREKLRKASAEMTQRRERLKAELAGQQGFSF